MSLMPCQKKKPKEITTSNLTFLQVKPMILCKAVDVPKLLDDIRTHYSSPSPSAPGKSLLSAEESREIRKGLLGIARTMLRMSVQPSNWSAKRSWAHVQVRLSQQLHYM